MEVCMLVLVSCIFEWRDGNEEERDMTLTGNISIEMHKSSLTMWQIRRA